VPRVVQVRGPDGLSKGGRRVVRPRPVGCVNSVSPATHRARPVGCHCPFSSIRSIWGCERSLGTPRVTRRAPSRRRPATSLRRPGNGEIAKGKDHPPMLQEDRAAGGSVANQGFDTLHPVALGQSSDYGQRGTDKLSAAATSELYDNRAPMVRPSEPGIFAELVSISSTRSAGCFGFRLVHRVDRASSYSRSISRCTPDCGRSARASHRGKD
jgi:hypothetical protein